LRAMLGPPALSGPASVTASRVSARRMSGRVRQILWTVCDRFRWETGSVKCASFPNRSARNASGASFANEANEGKEGDLAKAEREQRLGRKERERVKIHASREKVGTSEESRARGMPRRIVIHWRTGPSFPGQWQRTCARRRANARGEGT
jgi:hypothetical protein